MTDYTAIGLNDRLQSINSPLARGTTFVPVTDFESQVERGAVTRGKMGTITADVITGGTMSASLIGGGTLNLGGTNNQSGVFSLKDEGGTEKITMDKTGMTVNDGKITIKDSAGSSIIDSTGLNSLTTFGNSSSVYMPDLPDITTTSYTDIGSATTNIVTSRSANVLLLVGAVGNTTSGVNAGNIRITLGGTTLTPVMIFGNTFTHKFISSVSIAGAGTTAYKLQGIVTAGTNPIQFGGGYLWMGYLVLGK